MKYSVTTSQAMHYFGEEKAFEVIKRSGFDYCDYGYTCSAYGYSPNSLYSKSEKDFCEVFGRHLSYAKATGVLIGQTHAPFPTYPESRNEDELRYMIEALKKCVLATAILESPYMVIHAAMPHSWAGETDWDATRKINYDIFAEILNEAQKHGVTVALENMPLARIPTGMPEQLCEYIDMMDSPYMVGCLDTGHANITGIAPGEFARKLGSRLKVLHIHDNLGLNPHCEGWSDMHTAPYQGNIDWADFSCALREIGYDGTLSFETDTFLARQTKESFPVALRYLRELIETIEKL